MNQAHILTLVEYNFWANGRILDTATQITPEQLTQQLTPSPGWDSLRDILVHALDTEYGWRTALESIDDTIMQAEDFPDVATLKERWALEKEDWLKYVSSLSDTTLNQGYGADPDSSPKVWQTIMHVLLHSNQHRAESAAILTGYGRSPGELDFAVYLKETAD